MKDIETINIDCYINSLDLFILTFNKLTASLLFFVCHHSCLPISLTKLKQVFGQINTFKDILQRILFIDGINYILYWNPKFWRIFYFQLIAFVNIPTTTEETMKSVRTNVYLTLLLSTSWNSNIYKDVSNTRVRIQVVAAVTQANAMHKALLKQKLPAV